MLVGVLQPGLLVEPMQRTGQGIRQSQLGRSIQMAVRRECGVCRAWRRSQMRQMRLSEVVVEVRAVPQELQQEAERKGLRRKPHVCLLALWMLLVFFLTCLSQPALLRPLHPERVTHGQEHLEPLLQSREELHSMYQA